MKTEFRKVILMTRERRRGSLTNSMQELGLLHIEQGQTDIPEETEKLFHQRNLISRMIGFLENESDPNQLETKKQADQLAPTEVIKALRKIDEKLEATSQKIEKFQKQISQLAPWGTYDYKKFAPLIQQGLHVFLCRTDKKKFNEIEWPDATIELVNKIGSEQYFVAITDEEAPDTTFECIPLPKKSPGAITDEISDLADQQAALKQSLQAYLGYLPELKSYRTQTEDAIALTETQASFQEHFEGKLISISAWFPVYKEQEVIRFLEKEQVAWEIRKPEKGEDVPVLLKNKPYPGIFEPITKIFELPNYYETDPTPFLAVFYPILFAYCLGDMGYGFVLTTAMAVGYFSFLKNSRKTAVLGIILGSVTMFMGLIKSGSLFGIMLLPDNPIGWIRQLSAWVIIPDDSSVTFNAFNVSLMIGVIQILTGIMIAIYNKVVYEGAKYAVAPTGKLFIVTSLIWIFLADMQEIQVLDVLGETRNYLLIIGVILVVFFHSLDQSIGQRIGSAFMPLFFIFTGILGDILSYVRLFALGLASSVLGLVVNQIGLQIMEGGFFSIVIGVLFLLFGHTLNFGIAGLGSFVHPLRLTFVEFYGNVEFQGKGLAYRPFSKSKQTI